MLPPHHARTYLAKEKAVELGANIGFRNIDGGLQVIFRRHDGCSRVLPAMATEWPRPLPNRLRYIHP
jgi:hypothetical protein